MKKLICLSFVLLAMNLKAQQVEKSDSLGLPGDNLNLYSVLELFQNSATFEEFEKKLNEKDSKINNLDLNNDGKTDYIKVIDHQDGDSHETVLQVPVSEKENQDVAVIEIDKDKNGKIVLQIVGNEELYGKDYIVEPTENDPSAKKEEPKAETANLKKSDTIVDSGGNTVINNYTTNNYNTTNNYESVSEWPMVHYMYTPTYVVYVSPWYWYYYPTWWSPWSPWYWHDYYWHHHHYHHHNYYGYYHRTTFYRAPMAHNYYGPRRTVSVTVQNHRVGNVYKSTYTKRSHVSVEKKAGTKNPGFKERPENKNQIQPGKPNPVRENNNSGNQRPNSNVNEKPNKPDNNVSKPHNNNVSKPDNNVSKPHNNVSKPNKEVRQNKPAPSKPSQNTRSKPNQPKGGGGKKKIR